MFYVNIKLFYSNILDSSIGGKNKLNLACKPKPRSSHIVLKYPAGITNQTTNHRSEDTTITYNSINAFTL